VLGCCRDVFDPRAPDAHRDRALRAWVVVQQALALAPERAIQALGARRDPVALLRGLGLDGRLTSPELGRALQALARAGARLVPYPSPAYPWRLTRLRDAAPVLSVVGDVALLSAPSVTIVGARAATPYGRGVAHRLAADLARAGLVIVSGLAYGIDAAAHAGALAAGGTTIAVQACGPDRVYPARHRGLAARIAERGAWLCELPPGTPPRPAHFPLRNRLISGLARAVVVVEARERSGSLVTARHALDQGVDVFAVPGPITAAASAGANGLLRDGAAPALGADDILAAVGFAAVPDPERRRARLSAAQRRVVAALESAPASCDELACALGESPEALCVAITELELEGLVERDPGGRLHRVR